MNYIVLDLEWNQPITKKSMIKKPIYLHSEIIQIGAVKLDENYHILNTFKIMVNPKYYTRIHKKVYELTKITNEELKYGGFPFPTAFQFFKKWCGDNFVFLTWGGNDIHVLRDNMLIHNIDTSWLPDTYNIQIIFDQQIAKENRHISLNDAMEKIGEPAYEAHDALNDARNTAYVCLHLDMEKGLSEYESLINQLKYNKNKISSRTHSNRSYGTIYEALHDSELINFYCPLCGCNVKCEDVVNQSSAKYICIGKCENNDELFVRFKFRKIDDRYYVSRLIYEVDEQNKNLYLMRKQRHENAKLAYIQSLRATC